MLPLKVKEPWRPSKSEIEKEKEKVKRRKREKKKKNKKAHITIIYPHLCSCLALVLHVREFSCFISKTMWGTYTIELGLYIPMMNLFKSALGLHEQLSWMHPH